MKLPRPVGVHHEGLVGGVSCSPSAGSVSSEPNGVPPLSSDKEQVTNRLSITHDGLDRFSRGFCCVEKASLQGSPAG